MSILAVKIYYFVEGSYCLFFSIIHILVIRKLVSGDKDCYQIGPKIIDRKYAVTALALIPPMCCHVYYYLNCLYLVLMCKLISIF